MDWGSWGVILIFLGGIGVLIMGAILGVGELRGVFDREKKMDTVTEYVVWMRDHLPAAYYTILALCAACAFGGVALIYHFVTS